jgi:hypothetical protein
MEYLLGGAVFAFLAITGYFTIIHFVRKRTDAKLKPLLGVAETTETIEAERRERGYMENA